MPYRRYGGYRRYGRRRTYYGRGRSYGYSNAQLARRIAGLARKVPRPEFKHKITQHSLNPTSIATIVYLSGVEQGTDQRERIGAEYVLKSIWMKGTLLQAAQQTTPSTVRFILFMARAPQGIMPLASDLLEPNEINGFPPTDTKFNYVRLKDWTMQIAPEGTAAAGIQPERQFEVYKRIAVKCVCTDATANITNLETGGLFLLVISDVTVTVAPSVEFNTRLQWVDA